MESLSTLSWTTLLLFITILMTPAAQGGALDYPGRYGRMAEGMLDMMDAFTSAYQKRRGDGQSGDFSDTTGQHRMPGYNLPPGSAWNPGSQPGYPTGSPAQYYRSRLDGRWQGRAGEILVIRSGRFRIYQGRERYHEGLVYLDEKHLTLRQTTAGIIFRFEYAEKGGRLVLRDTRGNLMLYRKIK